MPVFFVIDGAAPFSNLAVALLGSAGQSTITTPFADHSVGLRVEQNLEQATS